MKFHKNGLKIFWSCHHFNLWNVSEIFHPIQIFQKKNSPVNPLNLFFSSIIILLIIALNHNSHISSIRSHIRCHKSLTWHTRHEKTIYRSSVSERARAREGLVLLCFTHWYWFHFITSATLLPSLFGNKEIYSFYTLTMLCAMWA